MFSIKAFFSAISLILFTAFLSPLYAEEAPASAAFAALEAAIADVQARAEKVPDVRFAFTTRAETDGEEASLVEYAFDPQEPIESRFTIIHPTLQEDEKTRKKLDKERKKSIKRFHKKGIESKPDRELIIDEIQSLFSGEARLDRETNDAFVFAFTPAPGAVNMGGDEDEDNDKAEDDKDDPFGEHLLGELTVSKADQRLTRMRFFSIESFKPAAVVQIKNFNLIINIAPVWVDGPLVSTSQEVHISGSAMFKDFEEHTVSTNSAFIAR